MSDVERICEINHARVRWAEEYQDVEPVVAEDREKDNTKKYKALRAGAVLTAGITGVGLTFFIIGLYITDASTIITGAIATAIFSMFGYYLDRAAEEELDDVLSS